MGLAAGAALLIGVSYAHRRHRGQPGRLGHRVFHLTRRRCRISLTKSCRPSSPQSSLLRLCSWAPARFPWMPACSAAAKSSFLPAIQILAIRVTADTTIEVSDWPREWYCKSLPFRDDSPRRLAQSRSSKAIYGTDTQKGESPDYGNFSDPHVPSPSRAPTARNQADRLQPRHAPGFERSPNGGAHRLRRFDPGRNWNGQGTDCQSRPRPKPKKARAVCDAQLRGHSERASGKRVVRP